MRFAPFLLLFMACGPSNSQTELPLPAPHAEETLPSVTEEVSSLAGVEDLLNLDYLRGRFNPQEHSQFSRVDDRYTDGDGDYFLHQATYAAFQEMHAAAVEDNIRLVIISATRNFSRQKAIWEAKWRGERLLEGRKKANEAYPESAERALAILRYSSMPGTSRHHWGSDLDLNRLTNEYFDTPEGKAIYDWLQANASDYGFCQPYTAGRPYGYLEERWHWSYLPLAQPLTNYARKNATDESIEGFEGAESAAEISVIEKYVLGINQACL